MRWGEFELHLISDGSVWLDGGAMFGVVPRPLWEQKAEPDASNRIRLGLNCLLVETGRERLLIDTGCGSKYSDKEFEIYGMERERGLLPELRKVEVTPEEVDWVINTHYHFDHCGGNTRSHKGRVVPTFPGATYVVSAEEYRDANAPNERTAATYFPHNWRPLEEAGQLRVLEESDGHQVVPGVSLVHTPGHTAGHHSVKIESGGRTLFFLADLCPTTGHIGLPWIMAYDLFPLTTLEVRKRIYHQAVEEEWLLFFEHDAGQPLGYLDRSEGRYSLRAQPWRG